MYLETESKLVPKVLVEVQFLAVRTQPYTLPTHTPQKTHGVQYFIDKENVLHMLHITF